MQLPSRGFYNFNLLNSTEFTLPKREDEINERNLVAGIGYDRQIRRDKIFDLSPWQKDGYNNIQIGKFSLEDPYTYACAIYLCRSVKPYELLTTIIEKEAKKKIQRF